MKAGCQTHFYTMDWIERISFVAKHNYTEPITAEQQTVELLI